MFEDEYSYPAPVIRCVFACLLNPLKRALTSVWSKFPKLTMYSWPKVFLDPKKPFEDVLKEEGFKNFDDDRWVDSQPIDNVIIAITDEKKNLFPGLIIKVFDERCLIQDEIETLMRNLLTVSQEGNFRDYFGLITNIKSYRFFKYSRIDGRFFQSEEFCLDIKSEFFGSEKSDDLKSILRLITALIVKCMQNLKTEK